MRVDPGGVQAAARCARRRLRCALECASSAGCSSDAPRSRRNRPPRSRARPARGARPATRASSGVDDRRPRRARSASASMRRAGRRAGRRGVHPSTAARSFASIGSAAIVAVSARSISADRVVLVLVDEHAARSGGRAWPMARSGGCATCVPEPIGGHDVRAPERKHDAPRSSAASDAVREVRDHAVDRALRLEHRIPDRPVQQRRVRRPAGPRPRSAAAWPSTGRAATGCRPGARRASPCASARRRASPIDTSARNANAAEKRVSCW